MRKLAVGLVAALVASLLAFAPVSAGSFDDVPEGAFFADAVEWLASVEVTTGTGDREFSPDAFVTRGQMAAFLARFGSFVEGSSPAAGFDDVAEGAFYDGPVDWLLDRGITTGTSASTYSPDAFVTRGQMAAFLWRFVGRTPSDAVVPFVDVPAGTFYSEAVAWLVEAGITKGTSASTYSPDSFVTRGQMATFLHRLAGEPAVGDLGVNRTAARPVGSGGGEFAEGDVVVSVDGLSGDGFVRVVVGESGGGVAGLTGAVSDEVEITVTDAAFDGPVTVTIPIETVDLQANELVVYVLEGMGVWQPLSIDVTSNVDDGQMFATFTLPAGVTLAPSSEGLTPLTSPGQSRIVTQVGTQSVASPTTSSTSTTTTTSTSTTSTTSTTTSTSTTSTTLPGEPLAIDVSAVPAELVYRGNTGGYVQATGGSGAYVAFRATGLPPGVSIVTQQLGPFTVGALTGGPTELGTYFAEFEVEDDAGTTDSTIVKITVVPNAREHELVEFEGTESDLRYPTVSPDGGSVALVTEPATAVGVHDPATGERVGGIIAGDGVFAVSDEGRHVVVRRFIDGVQHLLHYDTVLDEETSIASWPQAVHVAPNAEFVVFRAWVPVEGDPSSLGQHAHIWERSTGDITRLTDSGSTPLGVSDDGEHTLLFGLSEPGGGNVDALATVDRTTRTVTVIGSSGQGVISGDGDTVAFVRLVDGESRVSVWDRDTATYTDLMVDGFSDVGVGSRWTISADGRYLTFGSWDLLVPAAEAGWNLYVWDTVVDTIELVNDGVSVPQYFSEAVRQSADGSLVFFLSDDLGLTADGSDYNGAVNDLFLWRREDGSVERITNGPFGLRDTIWLSRDGSTVVFARNGELFAWLPGA